MKKFVVSIIAAIALSMAAAVAQTATEPSQGTSPDATQNSAPSQQQPGYNQPGSAAGQTTPGQTTPPDNSSTTMSEKGDKKLRGCVQSQGGQYVLESKKGKTVALSGQDVSAHVGHEVSVKGSWENAGAGTGVSGGTATEKTFNVTSVEMISDSCGSKKSMGNSGTMGTSPSTSTPSGTNSNGTSNPPQQ